MAAKPQATLVPGGKLNAEQLERLFEKLKGRPPTHEERESIKERLRKKQRPE